MLKVRCQLDICISQNPVGNRWYTQYNYKAVLTKQSFTKVWVGWRGNKGSTVLGGRVKAEMLTSLLLER